MTVSSHAFDDAFVIPALRQQLDMLGGFEASNDEQNGVYFSAPEIDLSIYDRIVLAFSGGKDSIACLLHLKDLGVDISRIEMWHHDVDGREGSQLMDWTFMADYNRKLADAFGIPLYFSWLQGGLEGEMLKQNDYSQPHKVETPEGLITLERDTSRTKPSTRRRFPQQAASLATRWCSSALKIDVGRRALTNQSRFNNGNTLFITGERREESSGRAKYMQFEPHACDRRGGRLARRVDTWRPVLHWNEERVWDALRRHGVIAPVPYRLSWSRSSCMTCIFNSPRIWATINQYFPERTRMIADYEREFDSTISRNRINVVDLASQAQPMEIDDLEALEQAGRSEYSLPVLLEEGQRWVMPAGAFGKEGCGAV
ncbi:phosphoadenosine phosphosulfate reductase family protein [Vreelandella rituensis]|uniref:Phosphohydrolase n=1 Tax=Vreelandella rituensis TaxID=2282306 RepID=A0A368U8V9_9GAMM|nr:phosphoadenosine phosphosulfate reductase family protein [Halomonas rituensis]RCV93628.1 phosphohydrolase [Halomonas rituensis]